MKVAIRADASIHQGSGHVMRCLSLARELLRIGADVTFFASISELPWLASTISESGIRHVFAEPNHIYICTELWQDFNLVIVDSYEIPEEEISYLNKIVPVLAIVDGDHRNIRANFFLDQNLGAESQSSEPQYLNSRVLLGSDYSLVRPEIVNFRLSKIRNLLTPKSASILIFFGGSDLNQGSISASKLFSNSSFTNFTVIAPAQNHAEIEEVLSQSNANVLGFTDSLPRLIAESDVVITAAGTSAWDISTIGTPAGYFHVADNQIASLKAIEEAGVGMGLGSLRSLDHSSSELMNKIESLAFDDEMRDSYFRKSHQLFDGRGCSRVAHFLVMNIASHI